MSIATSWENPLARILVIDDNAKNVALAAALLAHAGYTNVGTIENPSEAVNAILTQKPDLVLLDLHMPGVTGYDVLREVRPVCLVEPMVPILVLTADITTEARKRALDLGASDFITKPFDAVEFLLRVRNFLRVRQAALISVGRQEAIVQRLRLGSDQLSSAYEEVLSCLARAIEYRDDPYGGHAGRVGEMSAAIAQGLGLSKALVDMVRLAAPLHDIGKVAVPDSVLSKAGALTREEFETMQTHTVVARSIVGKCMSPLMNMVEEIAVHHHERWDGMGYPDGQRGEQIPITCRIVAVSDSYDAMTSKRPHKEARSHKDAVAAIKANSGTQFDPAVVEAFLRIYGNSRV